MRRDIGISDAADISEDARPDVRDNEEPSASALASSHISSRHASRWWLVAIVGVLIAEVCLLTVAVEFSQGPMAYLASPKGATFLLVTAVLGLLLCGNELLKVFLSGGAAGRRARWQWLAGNLAIFTLFFWWTWWLNATRSEESLFHLMAWTWPVGAMLVGVTAVLSCFSPRSLLGWLRDRWHYWIGAAIIAATYALWISSIQTLWRSTSKSSIAIASFVLEQVQAKPVVVMHEVVEQPVLGLEHGGALRVTRYCAEMESIVAFWVLGLTLLAATWRTNRPIRLLCVIVVGTVVMYLLNGGRLAMLVLVRQLTANGQFAVNLAHSRVSGILFLVFSVFLLLITYRWWHRRLG